MLWIAEVSVKHFLKKSNLRVMWEKRWIDNQAYLSQIAVDSKMRLRAYQVLTSTRRFEVVCRDDDQIQRRVEQGDPEDFVEVPWEAR